MRGFVVYESLFGNTPLIAQAVADATHASLIEHVSDAAIASQAILDAVDSVRTGTPLTDP
jgi:flavodoxin